MYSSSKQIIRDIKVEFIGNIGYFLAYTLLFCHVDKPV